MTLLYSNENIPLPVVMLLRAAGHDVLTVQETGPVNVGVSDEDVLEFAHKQNRAVITYNGRHFKKLHNKGMPHSGIIDCKVDTDFAGLARRIDDCIKFAGGQLAGKVFRVTRATAPCTQTEI